MECKEALRVCWHRFLAGQDAFSTFTSDPNLKTVASQNIIKCSPSEMDFFWHTLLYNSMRTLPSRYPSAHCTIANRRICLSMTTQTAAPFVDVDTGATPNADTSSRHSIASVLPVRFALGTLWNS